jgi:AraC-like DNA-binding protein
MIKHKDQISLNGIPVFTSIGVKTPLQEALNLPADACYLYVEKGTGHQLLKPGNITATAGTVILSSCGLTVGNMIAEQPKGEMDTIIVHLNRSLLEEVFQGEKPALWEEMKAPVNRYVVQTAANELVTFYFDGIRHLFQHKAALSDTILKIKLKEIVLLLLQSDNAEPFRQIIKSLFSERTFSFKEIIDAHILSAASIENLAQRTNCSLSTFKRRFKEIYGTSPGKYIMDSRLDQIAEQLRISDDAISHIGYDYGFESPEHLSRAFKAKFGVSPSSYRLNATVK